jgi:hypothetical protein
LLLGIASAGLIDSVVEPEGHLDFEWVRGEVAGVVEVAETLLEMLECVVGAMRLAVAQA